MGEVKEWDGEETGEEDIDEEEIVDPKETRRLRGRDGKRATDGRAVIAAAGIKEGREEAKKDVRKNVKEIEMGREQQTRRTKSVGRRVRRCQSIGGVVLKMFVSRQQQLQLLLRAWRVGYWTAYTQCHSTYAMHTAVTLVGAGRPRWVTPPV